MNKNIQAILKELDLQVRDEIVGQKISLISLLAKNKKMLFSLTRFLKGHLAKDLRDVKFM